MSDGLDGLRRSMRSMRVTALSTDQVKPAFTGRRRELLAAAAEAFENMSSPFESAWLSEHGVTLDECGDLSEDVATAIQLMVAMSAEEVAGLLLRAVMPSSAARSSKRGKG